MTDTRPIAAGMRALYADSARRVEAAGFSLWCVQREEWGPGNSNSEWSVTIGAPGPGALLRGQARGRRLDAAVAAALKEARALERALKEAACSD